jgi:hypothetical protein
MLVQTHSDLCLSHSLASQPLHPCDCCEACQGGIQSLFNVSSRLAAWYARFSAMALSCWSTREAYEVTTGQYSTNTSVEASRSKDCRMHGLENRCFCGDMHQRIGQMPCMMVSERDKRSCARFDRSLCTAPRASATRNSGVHVGWPVFSPK